MGEIKQGILGGFSGKVGTVVGSTWKNVSYMRALAISISNPRTIKQQTQRGKFAKCQAFLSTIAPYVRVGYKSLSRSRTPFNAAMSYILRNAINGTFPDFVVNYNRVLVARGTLIPVFNAAASAADGKLTLTWKDNSGMGDALATDLAMPLVYNKQRCEAYYDLNAATRADGTLDLELPDGWADEPLAVYLAFRSEDGYRVTNSLCLRNDAYNDSGNRPGGGNSGDTGGNTGGNTGGSGDGDQGDNPLG